MPIPLGTPLVARVTSSTESHEASFSSGYDALGDFGALRLRRNLAVTRYGYVVASRLRVTVTLSSHNYIRILASLRY